jgi:hypothetical protein
VEIADPQIVLNDWRVEANYPELNEDEMLISGELIEVRHWHGAAAAAAGRTGVDD